MPNRESIVFYKSFYDCVQMIPEDKPEIKVQMYDLIFRYQFYDEEIKVDWGISMAWQTIKAQIDVNNKKHDNGHKGGRPPKSSASSSITEKPNHNQSITTPKPNVNVNENENENYNVNDNDNDNVNAYLADSSSEAVDYYLDFVNPDATKPTIKAIEGYIAKGMTQDCLIAIFEYCLSKDRKNWAYIKSVIENKFKEGVRTSDEFEQSNLKHTTYQAPPPEKKKSAFHNFEQRDIDYNEIDDEYFAWVKGEE